MALPLPSWFTKVKAEAAKFGVPDWIWQPLATAESGNNPAAGGGGLFQIQQGYPGYHGQNLSDPVQNADLALPVLAKAYKAQGSPKQSVTAYENVIGHSGFDTFAGWGAEGAGTGPGPAKVKQNYINAYNAYVEFTSGNPSQSGLGVLNPDNGPGNIPIVSNVTDSINALPGAIGDKVKGSLPYILLAVGMLVSLIFLLHELESKQGASVPVGHFGGAPKLAEAMAA